VLPDVAVSLPRGVGRPGICENGGVTREAGCSADRTGMTAAGLMTAVALLSLSHYQKPRRWMVGPPQRLYDSDLN